MKNIRRPWFRSALSSNDSLANDVNVHVHIEPRDYILRLTTMSLVYFRTGIQQISEDCAIVKIYKLGT